MKTVRIRNKNIYVKDIVIAIIIAVLPFLFYIYKLAPHTSTWDLGIIFINAREFDSVYYFLWIINQKLLVVITLILWLLTCKHWWRNIILVPLIIELFKLYSNLDIDFLFMDEFEFIRSLPFTIPIILGLVYLLKKINRYTSSNDLSLQINSEIERVFEDLKMKEDHIILKDELILLKNNKSNYSKAEYLELLILLRQKIFKL